MQGVQKLAIGFGFILAFLLATTPAFSQKYGKIAGRVLDGETGEALPGANVIIDGISQGAATDVRGEFVILRVSPGTYTLRAEYIGYQRVIMQNVQVLTDLTTRVAFNIMPEALQSGEEVIVTAERPIVRKDLTSHESRVQAEELEQLPAQELGDVLNLQAGVTRDKDGGIHIRGGRSTEVAYLVNGIRITDDFTRTQSIDVANESIQELQVISGTFNAEYGEAMSGVINIITKTGRDEIKGSVEAWSGDYLSGADDIFYHIDEVSPIANNNFEATLSGPIINEKLFFFVTGRRFETDGYLYGQHIYDPQGRRQLVNGDSVLVRGDSSAVSMNSSEKLTGQASVEWRIASPFKIKVDFLGSQQERRNYDHGYRLNPFGKKGDKELGYATIANFTHILSNNTFYELTAAHKYNELKSNLFENALDPRYVHPDSLNTGANQFIVAGTELSRFERNTESVIAKLDLTSQITRRHQIKTGVEWKRDEVYLDDYTLIPKEIDGQQVQPFEPDFPLDERRSTLDRTPLTLAAYMQDKIEYESLIINVGLRYDRFDSRGKIPADKTDPNIFNPFKLNNIYHDSDNDGEISLAEQTDNNRKTFADREAYWWTDASVKTQLSPRLGIAYPITDRGVIHFSYGIFRQTPDYEQLYRQDEILLNENDAFQGPYGNPDLKPQRTTMYELGLQQQLTTNIGADLTLYYRDIRDWISVGPPINTALAGVGYSTRINRDFAEVKGVTLALSRRFAGNFAFNVDYTFQVATGTNSNPEEEFFAYLNGNQPTRGLTPLNWDQRHTLNANFYVGGEKWGLGMSERMSSGQPYTPSEVTARQTGTTIVSGLDKNSRRKPVIFDVNLNAHRTVTLAGIDVRFFMDVYNLFDRRNNIDVWGDSGRSDFTLNQLLVTGADAGWFTQPFRYSAPRRVQIGAGFHF